MSTASGDSVGSIFQNTSRVHPLLVTSTTIILVQVFFCFFLYFFSCAGSWLLHRLFSSCRKQGLFSSCSVWASHCSGSSWCEAWALGARASVLGAHGLTSCGSWALEHKLNGCGTSLLAPRQVGSSWSGLVPVSPAWWADSFPLRHQRNPPPCLTWISAMTSLTITHGRTWTNDCWMNEWSNSQVWVIFGGLMAHSYFRDPLPYFGERIGRSIFGQWVPWAHGGDNRKESWRKHEKYRRLIHSNVWQNHGNTVK